MAQFAQLNYMSGALGTSATASTQVSTPATPTTPLSTIPSVAAPSASSTSGDIYEQRSLTPCSSNDEKSREDNMSAKKRSRVFIDPLTEIPKLEV